MGRPPSDLDEYLDWKERLESFNSSGLEIDVFCLKEGVSRSTFYRWKERLKNGVPDPMIAERKARQKAESAEGAAFVQHYQADTAIVRAACKTVLGVSGRDRSRRWR